MNYKIKTQVNSKISKYRQKAILLQNKSEKSPQILELKILKLKE